MDVQCRKFNRKRKRFIFLQNAELSGKIRLSVKLSDLNEIGQDSEAIEVAGLTWKVC